MPYIGTSPSNGVRRVHTYTATASQTTFSGASSEGITLSYVDANYLDVFQNGVLLGSADYTSTSGTSVVLAQGASADDLIVIVVYDVFSVADTVSKTNGGTFDGEITLASHLNMGDNDKIKLGASGDLEIYHDTNHSYIEDTGTGELRLKTNGTAIRFQHGSETLSLYTEDGSVELFHDDSKKFETTSNGVTVTGTGTGSTSTTLKVANSSQATFVHAQQNIASNLASGNTVVDFVGKELSTKNSGYIGYTWNSTGANTNRLTFGHFGADYLMSLEASGNLLVGTTSSTGFKMDLNTNGGSGLFTQSIGSGNSAILTRPSGNHNYNAMRFDNVSASIVGTISVGTGSTSYNTTSDHRVKNNVEDMTGAIDRVKQLSPKRFSFIADETDTLVDGFLAHEAQSVVAEAVTGTHNEVDDDGNAVMQGIDQAKLVPLLTGALKEAIAKIEALETRITALENAE